MYSCSIKKKTVKKENEDINVKESSVTNIQEIITERPSIDFSLNQKLDVQDGIIKPVEKIFEKQGVRLKVWVDMQNELNAELHIPPDTLVKRDTKIESDSSQQIRRSVTSKNKVKSGVSGWMLLLSVFLIIGILIYVLKKFRIL